MSEAVAEVSRSVSETKEAQLVSSPRRCEEEQRRLYAGTAKRISDATKGELYPQRFNLSPRSNTASSNAGRPFLLPERREEDGRREAEELEAFEVRLLRRKLFEMEEREDKRSLQRTFTSQSACH